MDYEYTNGHESILAKIYSYLKLKSGYISEKFAENTDSEIYINDIPYPKNDSDIELIYCEEVHIF